MITAPARPQPIQELPSIKTQGHLALLEWNETLPQPVSTVSNSFKNPTRRTPCDRCYEGGTIVLFAATVAALAASLCRF